MLSMLMTTKYAPAEDRHELQQLLLHIAGGERDALAALYQRTRTAVYGLALSYLKNAQDAQDLTQDVLCAGVGLRGAVPSHRLTHGLAADRVPQPVPDAPAA